MAGRRSDVGPPRRLAPVVVLIVMLLVTLTPAACADTGRACGAIRREALDPNFLIHVLPGATGLHYRTDPPTSGAHQPAPHLDRVQRRPLPRPVQVGLLEGGDVLVQYRGLDRSDVGKLERLAAGHVVVAPNPDLPHPFTVVATAWVQKRTCTRVDLGALEEFIRQRAGKGPGAP